MLRRIAAVVRREYLERVRTRAFWLSTLLVPLFMAGVMIVPAWLAARGGGEFRVACLDLTRDLGPDVREELATLLADRDETISVAFELVDPGPDPAAARERLKRAVLDKAYDGLLVLPAGLSEAGDPEYVAPNVAAFRLLELLERSVNDVVVSRRLTAEGLDPERVRELTRRVELETLKLGAGGEETRDRGQAFFLSYVLMFVIYMSVLMYGIYVMRGVLEEKQSRIVEVILGAVRPFELMLGKILGIGAVGLTQFLLWTLAGFALTAPGVTEAVGLGGVQLPSIPTHVLVFFVVYFVLGFFLYGTLYAAVGAAFDTEQDAQQFQSAITMLLVVPVVVMIQVMNQPEGTLATVLSLIPFFAPVLMFLRMTLITVPPLEIAASVVLLLASIAASAWVAGKIYRVGILMSGARPSVKDLILWIREA